LNRRLAQISADFTRFELVGCARSFATHWRDFDERLPNAYISPAIVDQIDAATSSHPRGVTLRSVVIGSILVAGLCAIAPYNDYVVSRTYLVSWCWSTRHCTDSRRHQH
jgi:hypothetical protein